MRFQFLHMRSLEERSPISMEKVIVLMSLFNALIYNHPLFQYAVSNIDVKSVSGLATLAVLFAIVFGITSALLLLINSLSQRLMRILIPLFFMGNSLALYFMVEFGALLDRTMMGNALNTNISEAGDFLTPLFFGYLVMLGVFPSVVFLKLNSKKSSRVVSTFVALIILCLTLAVGYVFSHSWLWIDKHAKVLGGFVLPWSYAVNTWRSVASDYDRNEPQMLLPPIRQGDNEKAVVILVLGEAARAKNFSLYGYSRQTNQKLANTNIVAINNAKSCTTYTTGSLRCIFSHQEVSGALAENFEPLPSYLHRYGVEVIWRTNNWGEPRLQVNQYHNASDLREECEGDGCAYDGVLISNLDNIISASTSDKLLVVLHQKGSHGPAYHSRHPKSFEKYSPVCTSVELNQCSAESLVNAYDNTLVYTDHLLREIINILEARPSVASTMIYVSDHGESLGESGFYLHGAPNIIAPPEQRHIPFMVWMSREFKRLNQTSEISLKNIKKIDQSYVFHSVLGALGLESDVYLNDKDIFTSLNNTAHLPSDLR